MQGEFQQGSILWYWYDGWIALPFLLIALVTTVRLGMALNSQGAGLVVLGSLIITALLHE
jgi:hypothetical protein